MNDYQKAIKRGIENALDKYDKKCQAIAKNEPKVWLTIEEAKTTMDRLDWCWQNSWGDLARLDKKLWAILRDRIEQVEKSGGNR